MARTPTATSSAASRHVRMRLRGAGDFDGRFHGSGELSFAFPDAVRSSLEVDFSTPDELVVALETTAGVRLSADDGLVLSGGLGWDRLEGELEGEVEAELRVGRDLGVVVRQTLVPGPDTTGLEVTLSF